MTQGQKRNVGETREPAWWAAIEADELPEGDGVVQPRDYIRRDLKLVGVGAALTFGYVCAAWEVLSLLLSRS